MPLRAPTQLDYRYDSNAMRTGTTPDPSATTTNFLPYMFGVQAISGAYSAYTQGQSSKAMADANAAVSATNAKIAKMRAEDALKRGNEAASSVNQRGKKMIGSQKAAYAAQGIRTDTGSAQDVQQETADISEFDMMTIKNNALREAFGYQAEGMSASMQGILSSATGNMAASSGVYRSADTLLSGGLQAVDAYRRYGR